MKRTLSFAVAVCLLLSLWGCSGSSSEEPVRADRTTIEGPGFSSAEEAAEGYFKAWQSADVDAILATCAVESFVDNADLGGMVAFLKYYDSNIGLWLPNREGDEFSRGINRYAWVGELNSCIYSAVRYLSGNPMDHPNQPFSRDAGSEIDEFVDSLSDPELTGKLKAMELEAVRRPSDFSPEPQRAAQLGERRREYYRSVLNCTEFDELILETKFDGKTLYMGVEAGKLNGKWYVLAPTSATLYALGIHTNWGGVAFASDLDS